MPKSSGRSVRGAALSLGLAVAFSGCLAVDAEGPNAAGTNIPATGITAQGFAFSVLADDFTFEQSYVSPTLGDSLDIGLAVTSYAGGIALIGIADADGVARFAMTVTHNVAQGQIAPGGRPPYTVHLRFTGFTGVFALGVSAQAP